jgi:hypothetical protein
MTGGKNTPQKPGCDDVNEASLRIRLLGEAELLVGGIAEIRFSASEFIAGPYRIYDRHLTGEGKLCHGVSPFLPRRINIA